ncbi:MAG: hypothetical protein AAGC90_11305 [Curtobacterium sp.]|jgi:SagB-type dehydrogenase family enzyme|uniref:nitroreductase family protein n=1 Tax=Curtobacterium sp. Curtsp57 TaxID=3243047 RepID=UPI0031B0EE8E
MDATQEDELIVADGVRLTPDGDRWRVHELRSKTSARVDAVAAATLMAYAQPTTVAGAASYLNESFGLEPEQATGASAVYRERGWIVPTDERSAEAARWTAHGWSAAWEHHLATFDYPYEDYQVDGRSSDVGLMSRYYEEEPDTRRYEPGRGGPSGPVPTVEDALATFTAPLTDALRGHVTPSVLDRNAVERIAAAAFGVLGVRENRHPLAAGTLRRTSPSGGGRHPIEGYVWVVDVDGMQPGLYHHVIGEDRLELVGTDLPADVDDWFPGAKLRLAEPGAVFLLSVVPARNMYRYREPRTLRTIFMDAAHLASTVELLGRAAGLEVFGHHGIEHDQVERAAGMTNPLQEAVVYAVGMQGAAR